MRVLVILPTYNEFGNIERMLRELHAQVPNADILVIDDLSPDGTGELARKIATEIECIYVIERPEKTGLGTAYRDGFRWALDHGYEVLAEMDCDFSHDPASLPSLLALVEQGAEVAIGSRYVPGGSTPDWKLSRRMLSKFGNVYSKTMLGLDVKDLTTGFRAYDAQLLKRLNLDEIHADSYAFHIEMSYLSVAAGAKVVEMPIQFMDRVEGSSKLSAFTVAEALILVSWLGLSRPFRRRTLPDSAHL